MHVPYRLILFGLAGLGILPLAVQGADLSAELQLIQEHVEERDGMIFYKEKGDFHSNHHRHFFDLDRNRNYRVFVAVSHILEDVQVEIEFGDSYRDLKMSPEKKAYKGLEYYHCFIMNFRRASLTLNLRVSKLQGSYLVVVASAGKEALIPLRTTKVTDAQGNVYEMVKNIVYLNGQKFYDPKERHHIVHLCVTPSGSLFMLNVEGAVLTRNGHVYKGLFSKEHDIVKIAASYNNNVVLLRRDGALLNQGGAVVYKGDSEHKVVDLVEDRWFLYALLRNGKRIQQ